VNRCLFTIAILIAARAHAERPACFSERTLWRGAQLKDARGRAIGAVNSGAVVKVVDEALDEQPTHLVDVVLEEPFRLEARIPADRLEVYATRDIEVVPGLAWWAAGAPMRIYAARPGEALVGPLHRTISTTDTAGGALLGPTWTKCENLAGASSRDRGDDCCTENWSYAGRERAGQRVKLRRSSQETRFENETGDSAVSLYAPNLTLIRQKGPRSLVWTVTRDGVVVQGWVVGPLARRRSNGPDVISGCLEELSSRRWWPAVRTTASVLAKTQFSADPGGPSSGAFPAGTRVHVVERTGLHARVQLRQVSKKPNIILEGWVAVDALSDFSMQ